jgi:hypothetical protein
LVTPDEGSGGGSAFDDEAMFLEAAPSTQPGAGESLGVGHGLAMHRRDAGGHDA